MRNRLVGLLAGLLILAALALTQRERFDAWAFSRTGEEQLGGQLRGLWQLAGNLVRPRLVLQPDVPIAHAGVNPYGINTFLEQEVEPAKREEQVRLISAAGFHWLRQEFPWYDIEIHAKGDFEDRRFEPQRSAWAKYDHIVGLAEQYGLEIIARLSSPPAWSRAAGHGRGDFAPPDDPQDFAEYAAAVAARYAGQVNHFQVWNEPNIYPEWGEQNVDPTAYTALLCAAYRAIKAANPQAVVLSGALAPNADLNWRDLNDFIYLERMYAAGAADCFDVMSVQGYGLWSGPSDRRMRPTVINYARNQFIRDLMVRHGDGHKAIWISEMNWNAVPPESGLPPTYGQVTLEQQARYAPLAYERAQREWPWIGVVNFWFFKRATDAEKGQTWYYFRMAETDFTLLPVYDAMRRHIQATPPTLYPGVHQEDHWALRYGAGWDVVLDARAQMGAYRQNTTSSELRFTWSGTDLSLVVVAAHGSQSITVQLDEQPANTRELEAPAPGEFAQGVQLAQGLQSGVHQTMITSSGPLAIDALVIADRSASALPFAAALLTIFAGAVWTVRQAWATRRP